MIEFLRISGSFAIWFTCDSNVKADLFSTAFSAGTELTLIDPIGLSVEHRTDLNSIGRVARIVVTNANHLRDTLSLAQTYSATVFAPSELNGEVTHNHVLSDGLRVGPFQAIKIDGAAAGEFILYHASDGGTLIVGDALINFDPYGFAFLPKKYCSNQKQMIRSLRCLLDLDFNRIFFAHGHPITTRGRDRLALLLDS